MSLCATCGNVAALSRLGVTVNRLSHVPPRFVCGPCVEFIIARDRELARREQQQIPPGSSECKVCGKADALVKLNTNGAYMHVACNQDPDIWDDPRSVSHFR